MNEPVQNETPMATMSTSSFNSASVAHTQNEGIKDHHENIHLTDDSDSCGAISDTYHLYDHTEINKVYLPFPEALERVFFCLGQTTFPRYQCLQLLTWPWFERLSMFVILLNCITLGMYQPCANQTELRGGQRCDRIRCQWLQIMDDLIFGVFAMEMCIKIIAMGIFGKGSYLADAWNRLDFLIIVAG